MNDPLTTPITTTATQFRLDSIDLDVQGQMVVLQVSHLDAGGAVLKTVTLQATFAEVGITAGQMTGLKNQAVNHLKTRGTVN